MTVQEAIHSCFEMVDYRHKDTPDGQIWTLPHLVWFRPNKDYPETATVEYQQNALSEEMEVVVRRINKNATFTIKPNGKLECGIKNWYQFIVELAVPN